MVVPIKKGLFFTRNYI